MHIGELAREGGVSVQTVRYYERYGLLRKPARKPSRYRVYEQSDVHRIRLILQAKTLGFTLDEIKHILCLSDRRACPCGEVVQIGEERLAELQIQIAELTKFRDQLARAMMQWKKCPEDAPSGNAIRILIERTMGGSGRPLSESQMRGGKQRPQKAKSPN
jgi:DNA-binding transcriptional MerR regulator